MDPYSDVNDHAELGVHHGLPPAPEPVSRDDICMRYPYAGVLQTDRRVVVRIRPPCRDELITGSVFPMFWFDFCSFRFALSFAIEPCTYRHVVATVACLTPVKEEAGKMNQETRDGPWCTPRISFCVRTHSSNSESSSVVIPPRVYTHEDPHGEWVGGYENFRLCTLRALLRDAESNSGWTTVSIAAKLGEMSSTDYSDAVLLRMLDGPGRRLADVVLLGADAETTATGAQTEPGFLAHRCVLATASEYFGKMFCGDFREATPAQDSGSAAAQGRRAVRFDDISSRGLEIAVRYLYGASLPKDEIVQSVDLFIELWMFASVRLLVSLEGALAKMASIVARLEVPDEEMRFTRVFETAVLLGSEHAIRSLAQAFERVLQFSIDVYGSVLRMPVDSFERLVSELPPTDQFFSLCRAWLRNGDGTRSRKYAARICEVFGLDEMPIESLRCVENYEEVSEYIPGKTWVRIAKILANGSADSIDASADRTKRVWMGSDSRPSSASSSPFPGYAPVIGSDIHDPEEEY